MSEAKPIFVIPRKNENFWSQGPTLDRDATNAEGEREIEYASYFENEFGEMLVFFVERGSPQPVLYHSDDLMTPEAGGLERYTVEKKDGKLWIPPGVYLNQPERLWLCACWEATVFIRKRYEREAKKAAAQTAPESS